MLAERTLQRRLAVDGTTFRQIVEAARMNEALQVLRGDAPIPQARLAERLGYADASALAHAVRAHFGMSPGALRRELAADRAGGVADVGEGDEEPSPTGSTPLR